MPALTRRRSTDAPEECWHIYCGDVRVGTIAIRTGIPHEEHPWGWICGFYPGCQPSEYKDGTAKTFDKARREFQRAWRVLLSTGTEADFQACRDARDWTERKYAMWERCELLPSQKPTSLMTCPCGEAFDSHDPEGSYVHRGHIYAAQAADGIRR
jgi:hypothetical protein